LWQRLTSGRSGSPIDNSIIIGQKLHCFVLGERQAACILRRNGGKLDG
jgi:hypothetical protein